MPVKLALTTLCENPSRRTGLSTLFPEFISHARRIFPEVSWIVFVGRNADWTLTDPAVEVCREFVSNERPLHRLVSDHLLVAPEARRRGARALLTVGFSPLRAGGLPVAMHVFSVDHLERDGGPRSIYRRWAVNRGLKRSLLVIVNSLWTQSKLSPSKAPIVVSPEGIRHDVFTPDGQRGLAGLSGSYLLWVSNMYPYKRIELAFAAYARLAAATRSAFPFVVAGGHWGSGRALAVAAAERLGILDDIRFLGWVTDEALPALYRGAQAHVLSTSHETFGRSVLEAMACGCPNILQDLEVLREVAGETALYVDFTVPAAAAAVLEQVCADPSRQAQLRAAGILRAKSYSFERLARERVGAILDEIRKAEK